MGPCSNGGWTSERASAVNGGRSEAESTLPGRGTVRVDSGRYAVAERDAAPNLWHSRKFESIIRAPRCS